LERQRVELLHTRNGLRSLRAFLYVVEHVVYRLFGIVARYGRLDVCQELGVVLCCLLVVSTFADRSLCEGRTDLIILSELVLKLDRLLQSLETPFSLFRLECWYTQELCDRILGVCGFRLFCVVVLILDVDVARIIIFVLFVLEVVPARTLHQQ
jgi:hypothetical protein